MVKHNGTTYTAFILDSSGSMACASEGQKVDYDSVAEAVDKFIDKNLQGRSKCAVINGGRSGISVYSGWKGRKEKEELKNVVNMRGCEGSYFAPSQIKNMVKEAPGKFNAYIISDFCLENMEAVALALVKVLETGNKLKLIVRSEGSPFEFFTEGLKKYGLEENDLVVLGNISEISKHL
jgi:hypothetical protein